MRLKRKKASSVVGLDIEAGSIAAAEVQVNGSPRVAGSAVGPLDAGVFHEGEVLDPDRLAEALKDLFSGSKLPKQVRLGVGNQRVVVRTVRLPAIEDPKEMEAAVRFQAQEQIPMPLDDAILEHQVVGGVPAEEGEAPQVDVIVVAARRDMIASFLEPLRRAGLQPVGFDLTAFGMIRALAGRGESSSTNGEDPTQRPAARSSTATSVTSPISPWPEADPVSSPGYRKPALRRPSGPRNVPRPPGEHATQWIDFVGLRRPVEEVEGDPETIGSVRRLLEEGVTALLDEMRLSLDYYSAQDERCRSKGSCSAARAARSPGWSRAWKPASDCRSGSSRPAALAGFDENMAARLTLPFGLALEH